MHSGPPPDQSIPRTGDVLAGKYRLEAVISTGGMGVIRTAIDTSLGRRVAIKFLAPHTARNKGAAARFVREGRAAASIQSEHVVRVFEVGTSPSGAPYIVMEHLAGGDLAQVLAARGPLPIDEALDYVLEACEAIGEAHKRGIIHRDLKPQNLFLAQTPDGSSSVKVLDFGISKADDEEGSLTETGMVMGTLPYISPEQLRSLRNVDLRSDIWALGAILFELMTASPVFNAPTALVLRVMITTAPPTPLRARLPNAPQELEAVLLRCLHRDPHGRYRDVAALAEALAPFASERGRASAARVARVVHGGAGEGSQRAGPSSIHPSSYSSYPPTSTTASAWTATENMGGIGDDATVAVAHGGQTHVPSTRSAPPPPVSHAPWGPKAAHARSAGAGEGRSRGTPRAVLGAGAGLLVLAMLGFAMIYVSVKRTQDRTRAAAASRASSAAPAMSVPISPSPSPSPLVDAGAAGFVGGDAGSGRPEGGAPPGL